MCNVRAAVTWTRILSKEGKESSSFQAQCSLFFDGLPMRQPAGVHHDNRVLLPCWAQGNNMTHDQCILRVPSSDKSLTITNPLLRIQSVLLLRVLLLWRTLYAAGHVGLNSLQWVHSLQYCSVGKWWIYYSFLQGLHLLAERGGPEECFLTRHQPDLSCMTLWLTDSSFTSTSKINLSFVQMQKQHGGCFI